MSSRRVTVGVALVFGLGCQAHAPVWGPTSAQFQTGSLVSGGRERSFVYFAPPDRGQPRPLVVSLHGRGGTGAGMEQLTGMSAVADANGFLLVAPDGIDKSWADSRGTGPAFDQGVDDVKFISELIDLFVSHHGADPRAVYLVGMSNGAMMSLTLACKLSEKITAVVAVTGLVAQKSVEACPAKQPVSVAFIVGDADPLVPYAGGPVARDHGDVLSAEASADFWRKKNGCTSPASREALPDLDPADGTTTSVVRSENCAANSEVALVTVHGGGHTWPGGWQYLPSLFIGATSRDFSASHAVNCLSVSW